MNYKKFELIEFKNECPDCIFIKPSAEIGANNYAQINITLSFGEHIEKVPLGEIRISLKRLELELSLVNCSSPFTHREFTKPIQTEFLINRKFTQITTGKILEKNEDGVDISISSKEARAAAKEARLTESSIGNETEISDTFEMIKSSVVSIGGEENPKWIFTVTPGETELKGVIIDKMLCKLLIDDTAGITAKFTAKTRARDFRIKGISGLWPDKINRSKYALLQHLAYRNFKNKVEPHMCKSILISRKNFGGNNMTNFKK